MKKHPNNLVRAMESVGYSLDDMLPPFPGKDNLYLDELLRDSALALNRPVIPYGLLGIYPCQSAYFNISRQGYRLNAEKQPWPPSQDRINIFFFGGSTTLGFNIEDRQTIPAVLGRKLNAGGGKKKIEIYNFGSGNYTARHEFLRFLELLDNNFIPDYVIFLDGYNECFNALGNRELVEVLNDLYQREKKRKTHPYRMAFVDFTAGLFSARSRSLPDSRNYAPVCDPEIIKRYLCDDSIGKILELTGKELSENEIDEFCTNLSRKVWQNYLLSVELIRTLCSQKGSRPVFVWQPVPFFKTEARQRIMERLFFVFRHGTFCYFIYNWLKQKQYPRMQNTPDFINLAGLGGGLDEILYIDICHYSSFFCGVIAEELSKPLQSMVLGRGEKI